MRTLLYHRARGSSGATILRVGVKYCKCSQQTTFCTPTSDILQGTTKQVTWLASLRSEAQALVCLTARGAPDECYYNTIMLRLFFIVECGIAYFLCAIRVFEVRASSSSPTLPLCQISSLSPPPLLS